MPYVGDDVHRATTKRKWDHDGNDTLRFSRPGSNAAVFHVLNQQPGLDTTADGISTRKTLPPTKRLRAIHDDTDNITHSSHWRNASSRSELLVTTSQVSNDSACKGPVKIGGMTIMPCHVCHRRPTKKSDLDSFARCQSCQEQTCFVCIRECRRQKDSRIVVKSPSFEKQDEDVGESFNMNDADECDMAAATNIHAPQHDDDTRQDVSNKSSGNSSAHHAMICSRCCVEEGAEGEVVCLGCLSDMDTA